MNLLNPGYVSSDVLKLKNEATMSLNIVSFCMFKIAPIRPLPKL